MDSDVKTAMPGAGTLKIRVYATLRELLGVSQIDLSLEEAVPIRSVLQDLVASAPSLGRQLWDGNGRLTGYVTVFVNGRAVEYLDGLDTRVSAGDTVSLFPPIGGG